MLCVSSSRRLSEDWSGHSAKASRVWNAKSKTGIVGRMYTPKGQAIRDWIVAAAAVLMHARGVAGTSTDDVREAAGVSASQIYHYFRDKRALTRAVIQYQTDALLGFQESLLVPPRQRRWAARMGKCHRGQATRE